MKILYLILDLCTSACTCAEVWNWWLRYNGLNHVRALGGGKHLRIQPYPYIWRCHKLHCSVKHLRSLISGPLFLYTDLKSLVTLSRQGLPNSTYRPKGLQTPRGMVLTSRDTYIHISISRLIIGWHPFKAVKVPTGATWFLCKHKNRRWNTWTDTMTLTTWSMVRVK